MLREANKEDQKLPTPSVSFLWRRSVIPKKSRPLSHPQLWSPEAQRFWPGLAYIERESSKVLSKGSNFVWEKVQRKSSLKAFSNNGVCGSENWRGLVSRKRNRQEPSWAQNISRRLVSDITSAKSLIGQSLEQFILPRILENNRVISWQLMLKSIKNIGISV